MTTAEQFLRTLAERPGVTTLPNHEPSFWLRARIADLRARWAAGQTLACRHVLEHPGNVALAALWLPQVMVCPGCAPHALVLPPATEHVCDRCGANHPRTRPMAVQEEGVIIALGLCPPCYRREVPA